MSYLSDSMPKLASLYHRYVYIMGFYNLLTSTNKSYTIPSKISTNLCKIVLDCEWSSWAQWTACANTCGHGTKTRIREKTVKELNGGKCNGDFMEEVDCMNKPCPKPCEWGNWGKWSTCSKSCETGKRKRKRKKTVKEQHGGTCPEPSEEEESCNAQACPKPCQWGEWSPWNECSRTCGKGTKTRDRKKLVEEKNGGKCPGRSKEKVNCNDKQCPRNCTWEAWGEWGVCSKSCGKGTRVRTREKDEEEKYGGTCNDKFSEESACNIKSCPINCHWGDWSSWEGCTKTCNQGKRVRDREKLVQEKYGGKCLGSLHEEENCNIKPCPIPCIWGEWSEWKPCSNTCGKGERTRTREKERVEKHDGRCPGGTSEIDTCNIQACPTPCKLGQWHEWTTCSKSCGTGKRIRTREKEIAEANGGKCDQPLKEKESCNKTPCPSECEWEEWGPWKECHEPCKPIKWSEWAQCSRTCGKGKRKRTRIKESDCIDFSEQIESCNQESCSGNIDR